MTRLPRIGETWKHYKGNEYVIRGFVYGAEGENLEVRVLYAKTDGWVFSRPINDFMDLVGDRVRFSYYSGEATSSKI